MVMVRIDEYSTLPLLSVTSATATAGDAPAVVGAPVKISARGCIDRQARRPRAIKFIGSTEPHLLRPVGVYPGIGDTHRSGNLAERL